MINLLPPDVKTNYRYARRNRTLLRWISICGIGLLGAIILTGFGYVYMDSTTATFEKQTAAANEQLKIQNITGVQKQVTDISNNLQLVVQVLSKEILFSQLLKQLGSVTPPNVILTNLAISQTQGAIDITAQTADYNAATQLQVNLSDTKNQIFTKADIVAINCTTSTVSNPQYPCTATLRALFSPNNPFLFINTKQASS